MKALLIAAHGSRKSASNDEIKQLTRKIRVIAGTQFDEVACAFMQFASPTISEVIDSLAIKGAKHIIVFPHFIAAGSHVLQDIPEAIRAAALRYPSIRFSSMEHLGMLDGIAELIVAGSAKADQRP